MVRRKLNEGCNPPNGMPFALSFPFQEELRSIRALCVLLSTSKLAAMVMLSGVKSARTGTHYKDEINSLQSS